MAVRIPALLLRIALFSCGASVAFVGSTERPDRSLHSQPRTIDDRIHSGSGNAPLLRCTNQWRTHSAESRTLLQFSVPVAPSIRRIRASLRASTGECFVEFAVLESAAS